MDAYRIGVTIALVDHVTGALRLINRNFQNTSKSAAELQKTLDRIKLLGMGGAALGSAGYMGLKTIGEAVRPAMQLEHQIQLMKSAGVDAADVAKATAQAWKIAGEVQTSSVTEVMTSIAELRPIFGSMDEAVRAAGLAARMDAVLENATGSKGKDTAFNAAKALEFRGVGTDPKRYAEEANLMTAAIQATAGKVDPTAYLNFMIMSKGYGRGLSTDFLYGEALRVIQEMKPGRAGNAIAMLDKEFTGGKKLSKTEEAAMAKLGFLDSKGGIRSDITQQVLTDPAKFARETLQPAMEKAGIHGEAATAKFLAQLAANSNAMSLLTLLVTQSQGIQKDAAMAAQAAKQGGTDSYQSLIKADPVMQMKALNASWDTFMTALGQTLIPIVVPALNRLVGALHRVTDWAREHQTAVKIILEVVAGLSALAVVFAVGSVFAVGVLAIGAAPVVAGLTAAGAGLTVLAAAIVIFWDQVKPVVEFFSHAGAGLSTGEYLKGPKPASVGGWFGSLALGGAPTVDQPPADDKPIQVTGDVHLDGRKVGDFTADYLGRKARRPLSGLQGFDGTIHPAAIPQGL